MTGFWARGTRRGPLVAELEDGTLFGRLTGRNAANAALPLDRDSACSQMGQRPTTAVQ